MRVILAIATHALVGALGFALGVYALPILIAPEPPTLSEVRAATGEHKFEAQFRRDLPGSDMLHWGEGTVYLSDRAVSFSGELAPGPDYKLYLSPEYVDTEADFIRHKASMVRAGDVRTFDNFIVPLPPGLEPSQYNTVVVWCEAFGQFITAARYR